MTENGLPKATHAGTLSVGDVNLPCFVLQNGARVISGRGITSAIGMKGRGQGALRISTHKTLKPFISKDLEVAIQNPIKFVGTSSRQKNPTSGYEATILLQICESVLSARDAGALKSTQELRYAFYCDTLVRAFAKVGIIALVDEATGYQAERDRDELQKLLAVYLSEEKLKWAKMFPDEFYRQLFRLRGWEYRPLDTKRPQVVGKYTNQLVYEKLPPHVLEELQRLNPVKNKKTHRRGAAHFQYLSADIGQPDLRDHLLQLITIMRISPNWPVFISNFKKAFPAPGDQLELEFDDIDE